jgi:hypothetical protein
MRFVAVFAVAALVGCTTQPRMTWQRIDGRPMDETLHTAMVQCRSEAAQAAAGSPAPVIPSMYGIVAAKQQRDETLDAVMQGCMSKRGYAWVVAAPS